MLWLAFVSNVTYLNETEKPEPEMFVFTTGEGLPSYIAPLSYTAVL
jgi:hypothetical protein